MNSCIVNKNKFYVYHLINPITNVPFYVGKGYGRRMYDHENHVLKNTHPNNNSHLFYKIKKVLNECGKIGYKKIIENIDEKSALIKESEEIKRIGRTNLCNLTDGGEGISGYVYSDELKHKKSLLVLGKNNPFYGRKHSEQSLQKISISLKGKPSPMKGKTHSVEIRKKLSIINEGRKFSDGHRLKISESLKKSIIQLDLMSNLIRIWNSISDASKELNIDKSSVVKCLKGKIKSCGGYKWKYV